MSDESPTACVVSFGNKFAGAQQVPCDLGCGMLCYEHPENIAKARASGGYVICIFCAIKIKREHGVDINLRGQLWHGVERQPEVAGDVNQFLVDLLKGKY